MRALVIAPQPFFTPRGTPFSVYYRTLITAELGVDIDLLTYGQGADVEIPGVRIIRIPRFGILGDVKIGPSALKAFLDVFILAWTVGLLMRNRYDFVHAHEESVFFCRALKPLFGFKLVYDMHSSLPQQLTNFEFTKQKALIGLFERLESGSLSSADAVITICPELADYARPRTAPDRHFLIENSIFDEVRLAANSRVAEPNLDALPPGRPLVVYAGTFESYQGLDILIPAFAAALRQRPDAFLLLVGGTPDQVTKYKALVDELGIGHSCHFTGRVDQPTAKSYVALATVQTSPRKYGTNTPLKVYEQLASGIPLVATRIRSHTQVLTDEVCILTDPEPDAMAAGILTALNDQATVRAVTCRARQLYDERYSRAAYTQKMRDLLQAVS